ncbi:MAG: hypothetical protein K1X54_01905 [Flavobacteriales bacterium]|nr:hypothetical protein [Flavobacteriales bacterium]
MKTFQHICLVVILALMLTSCEELAFRQPMPHDAPNLTSFPPECIGTFVSESDPKDTLVIYPDSVKDERFILNDENLMRKYGKYYILNQHKRDRWIVAALRTRGKRGFDIYWFNIEGEKNKNSLSRVTKTVMVQDPETAKEYMLVDPTSSEFNRMLHSRAFQRKDKFRRIDS